MSKPLSARRPRGDMKKTEPIAKDDRNASKQRAKKIELLARMRARINGKPTDDEGSGVKLRPLARHTS